MDNDESIGQRWQQGAQQPNQTNEPNFHLHGGLDVKEWRVLHSGSKFRRIIDQSPSESRNHLIPKAEQIVRAADFPKAWLAFCR
jgi:hypothetical protein